MSNKTIQRKVLNSMLLEAYQKAQNSMERINACKSLAKLNGLKSKSGRTF